ncbi:MULTISPECIES: hypothetical protein [unclassified Pseudoalteromonas]|uniref:hypothetical protein n=1 Tax=unclassified Pseudoalteromonas TaxID=194690 RepID=UPI000CF65E03|nr:MULTISPECIES: hypothetical protein [unclassified Pseudoalteromonas]
MRKDIYNNGKHALAIAAGTAIYQTIVATHTPIDFYRPIYIGLIAFILLSIGSIIKTLLLQRASRP